MSTHAIRFDKERIEETRGPNWDQHITMPPRQFRAASGIGNTKLYELLKNGELESILIGRRRLILVDSYRRLIERQRAAAKKPSTDGDAQ